MNNSQINNSIQNPPASFHHLQQEQTKDDIPFLDEETLHSLAVSYKEMNDLQNKQVFQEFPIAFEPIEESNENSQKEISILPSNQNQQQTEIQKQQELVQIKQFQTKDLVQKPQEIETSLDQWNKTALGSHACCRDCVRKIRGKTCVCIVPTSLRKQDISQKGCRTCQCKGCGDEANVKPQFQRLNMPQQQQIIQPKQQYNQISQQKKEVLQNGCCRDCMKAFSKNGKSCLCQVPKGVRKFELPTKGCNICGCKGCNPGDLRKYQENKQRLSYSRSHSRSQNNKNYYSKHRLSPSRSRSQGRRNSRFYNSKSHSHHKSPLGGHYRPSFDQPSGNKTSQQQQESLNFEQMNFSNFQNSVFCQYVQTTLSIFPPLMGFGIPERTHSYILGKPFENIE